MTTEEANDGPQTLTVKFLAWRWSRSHTLVWRKAESEPAKHGTRTQRMKSLSKFREDGIFLDFLTQLSKEMSYCFKQT